MDVRLLPNSSLYCRAEVCPNALSRVDEPSRAPAIEIGEYTIAALIEGFRKYINQWAPSLSVPAPVPPSAGEPTALAEQPLIESR